MLHMLIICLYTLLSNMQCACAILSSVACHLYNIFLHYLTNGKNINKILLSLKCVSDMFLILRINERDITINVYLPSCKILSILVRF